MASVTTKSATTPERSGRATSMLSGVRPSMSLASWPHGDDLVVAGGNGDDRGLLQDDALAGHIDDDHVERLLGHGVVLALEDFLEAAHGVGDRTYLPGKPVNCFGDEERLREEALDLAGAGHGELVVLGELVDAENRDDVLQVLVALQDLLHARGRRCSARSPTISGSRCGGGGQRIDGRVDALLGDRRSRFTVASRWAKVVAGAGSV
jgi:hypothetical protein